MKKVQAKMLTVYSKNGNPLVIAESLKSAFVGRGYSLTPPAEKKVKEESK